MLRLAASGGGGVVVSAGTKREMDARISHTIVSASESMKRMATAPLRCTHLRVRRATGDGGEVGAGGQVRPKLLEAFLHVLTTAPCPVLP